MKKSITSIMAAALVVGGFAGVANAQLNISSNITTDTTWTTADNPVTLQDIIYVTDGADLTIEPGVVIKGVDDDFDSIDNGNVGTLVITRGSKIFGNGTAENPIIFTAVDDNNVPGGAATSQWTSVNNVSGVVGAPIILGKTYVSTVDGSPADLDATEGAQIEGLTAPGLGQYGGSPVDFPNVGDPAILADENDDSGSMSYWSMRYAGEIVGNSNEINGFTLGGVGRATELNYIEVVNGQDDGVEFFGGTVSGKNIAVFNSGDDSIDWDQGFRGKLQYLFVVHGGMNTSSGSGFSDQLIEGDGSGGTDGEIPASIPTIHNATFVGMLGDPTDTAATGNNEQGILLRDGGAGRIINSVAVSVNNGLIALEDTASLAEAWDPATRWDSDEQYAAIQKSYTDAQGNDVIIYDHDDEGLGTVDFTGFIAWNNEFLNENDGPSGNSNIYDETAGNARAYSTQITDVGDLAADIPIVSISQSPYRNNPALSPNEYYQTDSIDPRAANSATSVSHTAPNDGFFDQVDFAGAFSPNYNWLEGWSLIDELIITSPDNASNVTIGDTEFLFGFQFTSTEGATYAVQASDNPAGPFLTIDTITGIGGNTLYVDTRVLSTRQFYQVTEL